jgi:hypothetical protein
VYGELGGGVLAALHHYEGMPVQAEV